MTSAVFLDRDGVLNELVPNPGTGEREPPRSTADLRLFPGTIESLRKLSDHGHSLFLVSNQPDYAKGKTSLETIERIHMEFDRILRSRGVHFKEYYYCYHHPKGIVPGYSYDCECRKPKPFFLFEAARVHGVDLPSSWMIGDRDIDIECGSAAGTKTILIEYPLSADKRGGCLPDYKAKNLNEAVSIIT